MADAESAHCMWVSPSSVGGDTGICHEAGVVRWEVLWPGRSVEFRACEAHEDEVRSQIEYGEWGWLRHDIECDIAGCESMAVWEIPLRSGRFALICDGHFEPERRTVETITFGPLSAALL